MLTLRVHSASERLTPGQLARAILDQRCTAGRWLVVTVTYSGQAQIYVHRAPKAAMHRLGSLIRGKLRNWDAYASFAIAPRGEVYSQENIKTALRSGWL